MTRSSGILSRRQRTGAAGAPDCGGASDRVARCASAGEHRQQRLQLDLGLGQLRGRSESRTTPTPA